MTDKMENMTQKLSDLFTRLRVDFIKSQSAFKFLDIYGEVGMFFMTYITPLIWIAPLCNTILITIVFKKAKLYGTTQILLIGIMFTDVLFSLLTGARDGYLYLTDMNYGFMEYKICRPMIYSHAVLKAIHGTSLFFRCLLTTRNMFLFAFPIKYRLFTSIFKRFTILGLCVHLCACILLFSYPIGIPMQSFRTVQHFRENRPLKVITACAVSTLQIDPESLFLMNLIRSLSTFSIAMQVGYFSILPILVQIINVIGLIIVIRRHMKTMNALMHGTKGTGTVIYLRLLRVTIFLGISFLLQELPPVIFQIMLTVDLSMETTTNWNSSYLLYVAVSFAVTKPLDIIIYASQSKKFRHQLEKMFCCK